MDVGVSVSFFKNELGSTIELAVQAAVETVLCEIAKVVGTKLVGLQVEIGETLNENQTLKRRLKRTETELKSVRECEKTTRAKTSNTISNKRHAPHFTEQLGVPSWANNNNSPAFVPQPKERGLNVDEPCVSFLGDQVTEAGTEYNAAGFAHCLPILINRDCDTQGASLADPETSHLIIQEDGTDRSVSIRDDAFPRIDDIWGGGGATGKFELFGGGRGDVPGKLGASQAFICVFVPVKNSNIFKIIPVLLFFKFILSTTLTVCLTN